MWNNVIFGFLLIATVCTQCQSTGYPKVKPDNPLELPSEFNDKTNVITGSVIQQSTNTAQDDMPEQLPADDNPDDTIQMPEKKYQVTEQVQEDDQHQHVQEDHHYEHGEDGAYNKHDDGTGWDIRKSVPGEPGRDYPTYANVVDTSFTCSGKTAGYYADLESRCQIFRICTTGSVNAFNSFLCPNGSLFNQAVLTCDWWPNVDCQGSAAHYDKNTGNIPKDLIGNIDVRFMLDAPLLNPYRPVHEQSSDGTTNNHISDTKIYSDFQVTPRQEAITSKIRYTTPNMQVSTKIYNDFQVTPEQDAITSKIRYTTPNIQISTFESTPTPSAPIIESSISTQQYQTGTYDVNEKPTTDSLILYEIPANTEGNVLLVSTEQNKPVTFVQTNVNEQGPEKISLIERKEQKQVGLSHQPNVIGAIPTNAGLNIQTGSRVNTNTDEQVIGGLNLASDGAIQSETNKQTSGGISKSIELPGSVQAGGIQQHYARILSHGNEQTTTGAGKFGGDIQNQPDQTVKQFGDVFNQQSQLGTQQQALNNNFAAQAQNIQNDGITSFPTRFNTNYQLDAQNQGGQSNFGVQNQQQSNINTQQGYNQGFTGEIQSAGLQNQALQNQALQNQGLQNQALQNQALQNQALQNHGLQNQALQNQGLQNQQGFQSNFGINGYNYNQGFTGDSQNQGAYNLGSLNVGGQVPYDQNAFYNQNSFISNQNAGAGAFNPNFHEQTYQNFNFFTKSNGQHANYEVSKSGAAQSYKGESLSQHANGHTHNYAAYKESTKVEIVPSLGFTLTEERGRASYASALINGLVQEKRGASAANYESISPTDVRYSSYQGPSSYLVPQSSVQHLPNAKRESTNQTTL